MRVGRIAALVALALAAVLVVVVLMGGSSGHSYKLQFETGGQLVKGNQVLVGGQPIGIVDAITLADDGLAEVEITVDEPLHEGTVAVIRSTSLSGVANRYVSVDPGPTSEPEVEDGGILTPEETVSPVDLDQLFATLDGPTRKALQEVVEGSAVLYTGNNEEARKSYKYLGPALQSGQRLLADLTRDERVFSQFLVRGSSVLGAVAERRQDLSALTQNANEALSAIAAENESLDRTLAALPPAMRQANTTFVNLRAAFDDLDSVVATAKPATRDLAPFLRDLRPVARRAVPVVGDLRLAVARSGPANDLTDLLLAAPGLESAGARTRATGIAAMNDTQAEVELARAYSPDLVAFITKLGQASAYYDGNGHYVRVMPAASNIFDYNEATSDLDPLYNSPAQQFDFFSGTPNSLQAFGFFRCPGAATEKNAGWTPAGPTNDHPFLDDGNLSSPGDCDATPAGDTPYGVYGPPGP